jgi:hypothetical protein
MKPAPAISKREIPGGIPISAAIFWAIFRGLSPIFFGQGEGKREGQVAEFGLGRIEKIDLFPDDGVDLFQPLVENGPEFFFQGKHNRLIIAQGF